MNVLRLRTALLALVGALAVAPASPAATTQEPTVATLVEQVRKYRAKTSHWQRVMGKQPRRPGYAERRTTSIERLKRLREGWRRKAIRVRRKAKRPPHEPAWRCIHRYEGPWDDPNAPYYGGLQMDLAFQRSYGRYLLRRKGTANRWHRLEQMWTAERALRAGRGFYPWPVAARRCGLI